ncbi:MAG: hypothetical protein EPN68_08330 [Rhodanobacter sp.]|nr:MAG: hypothetical protein EPN68_08330 [Rhodanobacter sp.]
MDRRPPASNAVIPAQAGIQRLHGLSRRGRYWIPACAGMTSMKSDCHLVREPIAATAKPPLTSEPTSPCPPAFSAPPHAAH